MHLVKLLFTKFVDCEKIDILKPKTVHRAARIILEEARQIDERFFALLMMTDPCRARNITVFTTSLFRTTSTQNLLQKLKRLSQLTRFKHPKENRSAWIRQSLHLLVSSNPSHLQRKTKPKLSHQLIHRSLVQRGPLKRPTVIMSLPLSILDLMQTQSKGLTLVDSLGNTPENVIDYR